MWPWLDTTTAKRTERQGDDAVTQEATDGQYSQAFLDALTGGGAWAREARLLVALAAQDRITLDEEQLALSDVRDLQARVTQQRRTARKQRRPLA